MINWRSRSSPRDAKILISYLRPTHPERKKGVSTTHTVPFFATSNPPVVRCLSRWTHTYTRNKWSYYPAAGSATSRDPTSTSPPPYTLSSARFTIFFYRPFSLFSFFFFRPIRRLSFNRDRFISRFSLAGLTLILPSLSSAPATPPLSVIETLFPAGSLHFATLSLQTHRAKRANCHGAFPIMYFFTVIETRGVSRTIYNEEIKCNEI